MATNYPDRRLGNGKMIGEKLYDRLVRLPFLSRSMNRDAILPFREPDDFFLASLGFDDHPYAPAHARSQRSYAKKYSTLRLTIQRLPKLGYAS